jgi:hypothetical protein
LLAAGPIRLQKRSLFSAILDAIQALAFSPQLRIAALFSLFHPYIPHVNKTRASELMGTDVD